MSIYSASTTRLIDRSFKRIENLLLLLHSDCAGIRASTAFAHTYLYLTSVQNVTWTNYFESFKTSNYCTSRAHQHKSYWRFYWLISVWSLEMIMKPHQHRISEMFGRAENSETQAKTDTSGDPPDIPTCSKLALMQKKGLSCIVNFTPNCKIIIQQNRNLFRVQHCNQSGQLVHRHSKI